MLLHNSMVSVNVLRRHIYKTQNIVEGICIVTCPFQFVGIESTCNINYKLEGLNRVFLDLYVMPLVDPNLESRNCMCVVDLDFVYVSQQTL